MPGWARCPSGWQLGPEEAYRECETADLLIPSPGVPMDIPAIRRAREAGVPVWSEIELAYRLARAPILAITGTKGKTTTTTLIGLLLQALDYPVYVGGNIGHPLIELAVAAREDELLVAEVSSFQLEGVEEFHPAVAVFTNLYPDHLNRYDNSMEAYLVGQIASLRAADAGGCRGGECGQAGERPRGSGDAGAHHPGEHDARGGGRGISARRADRLRG